VITAARAIPLEKHLKPTGYLIEVTSEASHRDETGAFDAPPQSAQRIAVM